MHIACCWHEQCRKGPRNVGGFQELEREGSGFSSERPEKSLAVLTGSDDTWISAQLERPALNF